MKCAIKKIMLAVLWSVSLNISASEKVVITVADPVPFHIHPQGKAFTIELSARSTREGLSVAYYWRDFSGKALSPLRKLTINSNQPLRLQSPSSVSGYYGLVFKPGKYKIQLNDRWPGEELVYGFGIGEQNPVPQRSDDLNGRFGTVHTNRQDPYMPSWIKTMTWKTAQASEWNKENSSIEQAYFHELPLIIEDEWDSDDRSPVSLAQLEQLTRKVTEYFEADQRIKVWELGIEENLRDNFKQAYYWDNLSAKSFAVRQAADFVNPEIKLIYQIAELEMEPVRLFLNSQAAQNFDILSLHPYQWPEFAAAESWLKSYLQAVREEMQLAQQNMPIWFTEVGAPHHGNHPKHFFGYPINNQEKGVSVQGLTRQRAAAFMIKVHVVALQEGVEKIFWYNYIDRESDRKYAENHFGMIDFWGYPKPVYLAYIAMYSQLKNKKPEGLIPREDDLLIYVFDDLLETTYVVWKKKNLKDKSSLQVSLSEYNIDLETAIITDAVGTPYSLVEGLLDIGETPLFITRQK